MTRYEEEACATVIHNLPAVAKSLDAVAKEMKIANDLKALELKGKQYITPEMVDSAIDEHRAS